MTAVHSAWREARNVLCIRLDTIGDVLMTTPAIRAVQETIPHLRRITLMTSGPGAEIARLVTEVDETIVYDAPWLKHGEVATPGTADWPVFARLRARRFDAAIIFTVYSQSALPAALMCTLAGIPLRAAHCRENPYALLSDWVRETEPEQRVRHEVERQIDLVRELGFKTTDLRMSLTVPLPASDMVSRLLDRHGITPETIWLVMHPGASAPSRRYPVESFAAAARMLVERIGCRIFVTGEPGEHGICEAVCAATPGVESLAGELDLDELCALIAMAPLLISNNTGPAHIAAAVGTPVVDLYALTNPQHTPWMVVNRTLSFDVPCKYCYHSICPMGHHDCLRRITPAEVADAACDLLALSVRGTRPTQEAGR